MSNDSMKLSQEELDKVLTYLKTSPKPSLRVETQAQAEQMTAADPVGHQWQVGERYITVQMVV